MKKKKKKKKKEKKKRRKRKRKERRGRIICGVGETEKGYKGGESREEEDEGARNNL